MGRTRRLPLLGQSGIPVFPLLHVVDKVLPDIARTLEALDPDRALVADLVQRLEERVDVEISLH